MLFRSTGALATLVGGMEPRRAHPTSDFHRRMLADRLRDPRFRTELERLRAEMVEQLAPAAEGPVVNPGRRRRGRLVFGDATE